jgi:hypothetical protein
MAPVLPPSAALSAMPLRSFQPDARPWLNRLLAVLLGALIAAGGLAGCSAAAAGLNAFQSPDGRYAFLYPTGWTRVVVSDGPQVVFHDLINSDETLSLVISDVNPTNDLSDLGSAVAVGEKLRRVVIAPAGSGREAELVEAAPTPSTTWSTRCTWRTATAMNWPPWWPTGAGCTPWR